MKIALGTAQFGLPYGVANRAGQVPPEEAAAILAMAARHGVDTLDTAIAYGDSETRLGQAGVAGWHVVSKLPAAPAACADAAGWVESEVQGSLARLKVDRLYGLLLHRPAQLGEPRGGDLWKAMERVKASGIVRKIGVSIYEPSELDALPPEAAVDLVQAPLNILDRRLITSGWLARLEAAGTEVHARSSFLQGLLLMEAAARPSGFDRWRALFDAYEAWVAATGLSARQACLGFALGVPGVSRVVVGVDSAAQLQELLDVRALPSPPPDALQSDDPDLLNPARWRVS